MGAGKAWFDLMMGLQRASLQSFSSYSPISETRISGQMPHRVGNHEQVVAVGEERLNVATHTVQGETTRIRRRVVTQPAEQQVTLVDEKVVVERRSPTRANPKPDVLTETVIEMSDSRQVPTVWKSLHVAEEVVLRKQVSQRTERVHETLRRDVVDVEHTREAVTSAPAYAVEGRAQAALSSSRDEAEHGVPAPSGPSLEKRLGEDLHDKKPAQGPQAQPAGPVSAPEPRAQASQPSTEKPLENEPGDKKPGQGPTPQFGGRKI
jgi:stress response protein YsnF